MSDLANITELNNAVELENSIELGNAVSLNGNILLSLITKYGVPALIFDNSAVFTDDAGTTPAGIGDVVGKEADQSGGGHDRSQATTASKPILRTGPLLEFTPTLDHLSGINPFTGSDLTLIWCGKFRSAYAATTAILSFADTSGVVNNVYLRRDSDISVRFIGAGTIGNPNFAVTVPSGTTEVANLYSVRTEVGDVELTVAGVTNTFTPSTDMDYSVADSFAVGGLLRSSFALGSDTDHNYYFAINARLTDAELLAAKNYIAGICGV